MFKIIKRIGSAVGTGARAFVALVGIATCAAVANYAVTVGSGTTFGSVVVGGIHYAQQFICDLTTPSQCAAVSAGGAVSTADSAVLAALGTAVPAGTNYIGKTRATDGTNDSVLDPCKTVAKSFTSISISTATTTRIITETSSIKTYICGLHIVTNATNNVAIIEGTGSSCSGGTPAGMSGGTTAASGWNFSANGGLARGNGDASIMATANAAYSVCLVTSAATQLSGTVAWVQR